jgi:N-acetylglucosamine kinase-like BadF-type ATPase
MDKYLIAIDAGGTSTDGALFNFDGKVVKTCKEGSGNYKVNATKAKEHIKQCVEKLLLACSKENVKLIQIGMAGMPNEEEKKSLLNELETTFQIRVDIVSDALIALLSIEHSKNECPLLILGGTGSIVMIDNGEKTHRFGGFGHLLGDEGSAYDVVIRAFKEIIDIGESNQEETMLYKELLKQINAKDYLEIKDFVYKKTKEDIASLAKVIGVLANYNDQQSKRLLQEEGKLLAGITIKAIKNTSSCKKFVVGLRGGFLNEAPYVKDSLLQTLDKIQLDYTLEKYPGNPLQGAYYLGLRKINEVTYNDRH